MTKHRIAGRVDMEKELIWDLVEEGGKVFLVCSCPRKDGGYLWYVLKLGDVLTRVTGVSSDIGLQVDAKGRVRIEDDPTEGD